MSPRRRHRPNGRIHPQLRRRRQDRHHAGRQYRPDRMAVPSKVSHPTATFLSSVGYQTPDRFGSVAHHCAVSTLAARQWQSDFEYRTQRRSPMVPQRIASRPSGTLASQHRAQRVELLERRTDGLEMDESRALRL